MAKFFYFLEMVIIFIFLLPFALNYRGEIAWLNALTIPSFSQVKSSVSVTSDNPNDSGTEITKERTVLCENHQVNPTGFPFVYKSHDTCDRSTSYKVGLFFNYVTVLLVALGVTKLTSMAVNRITKNKE